MNLPFPFTVSLFIQSGYIDTADTGIIDFNIIGNTAKRNAPRTGIVCLESPAIYPCFDVVCSAVMERHFITVYD